MIKLPTNKYQINCPQRAQNPRTIVKLLIVHIMHVRMPKILEIQRPVISLGPAILEKDRDMKVIST